MKATTSSMPYVSVIIPTYNRASFLPDAIESILNQTYEHIEIIVVDDGSTDATYAAVEPFKERIRYILTEHKGPSHARNVGMKEAMGKYFAFLDSDDSYHPFKLETQVAFMEDHPEVNMVYTEYSISSEDGRICESALRSSHNVYADRGWHYEDIFPIKGNFMTTAAGKPVQYYIGNLFKYALMGPIIPSFTILFPRTILQVVGFQNETYKQAEDYEFTLRICKHFKVAFLNLPTYVCRHHADQTSYVFLKNKLQNKPSILHAIDVYSVMLNAVLDWGYRDKEYYGNHKELIDMRLAELYHVIGLKWLQYGDGEKASDAFQKSYNFGMITIKYFLYRCLCFLPGITFRCARNVKYFLTLLKQKS